MDKGISVLAKALKENNQMQYFSNFIQYILFPYHAACKCQGKNISLGLSKHSSIFLRVIHKVSKAFVESNLPHKSPNRFSPIFKDSFQCVFHALWWNSGWFIRHTTALKHIVG